MNLDTTGVMGVGALELSPWVFGPLAFVVWVVVLWLVQHFILRRMRQSENPLVAQSGRAMVLPVVLAVVVVGLLLLQRLLPLPAALDRPAGIVVNVLLVLLAAVLVDRLLILLLTRLAEHTGSAELKQGIVRALTHLLVYGIGLLVVLAGLGVSIAPLLASLGVVSLAVALALQGPLANFFAGLFILADRSLNPGDFVILESGEKGYIERVGLRHTRIRMLPGETVIIPNEKLISSTVHNTSLPKQEISLKVQVGVHYDSDLAHVEQVTVDVAQRIQQQVAGAVEDFKPFIRYHTFDSSSINFSVILRVKDYVAGYLLKHEFIKALHKRYREEGIVIPYPLRTIHVPDSTATKLRSVLERPPEAGLREGSRRPAGAPTGRQKPDA